ncbi:MAG: undecaprenyl/decaprenyl-phosphate alpha-N-acetylglucosaminyl 1-phosphate transferase [Oscillospiraceae bacterium]|nr:undecaprenyl/decaprenyl-phosphate alpha-N-acetylglucosaminyl 1-phosphate transferase [Oscillospiraceae bacterium]
MPLEKDLIIKTCLALVAAFAISFAATPIVKSFAHKVGAMDNPGEMRRIHDRPIPRLGGLAIFLGFLLSVVLFAEIDRQVRGVLTGAVLIVIVGVLDDIISVNAWVKIVFQTAAAIIAAVNGVAVEIIMNPNIFSANNYLHLGMFSVPLTVIWIVAITNSVNLIDGLDGLACGVSAISSVTMLVIAAVVSTGNVVVIPAALAGACIGFIPYNFNPAKIFMGDTGALLLGYVLATLSVMGLFKFYAVITFAVPFLVLAVPLVDTVFAFFRRLFKGRNPLKPDRGHFHHRLIDMGLSQKQAVAILYSVSAILGVAAVILATGEELKALFFVAAVCVAAAVTAFILREMKAHEHTVEPEKTDDAPAIGEKNDYEDD